MRKKRSSKSKDRNKNDKHSRRKRKSSSSESDSESLNDTTDETKNRRSNAKKSDKEMENNVGSTRVTRHSKRLAALGAGGPDEIKEEMNDVTTSPVTTGKSSPFSSEKGSPSKEIKKKECLTPDKPRLKDSEVWKVKSANGAGSGELQKLKICRQRSPENTLGSKDLETNSEEEIIVEHVVGEEIVQCTDNNKNNCHDEATIYLNAEEIANIQLPSSEFISKEMSDGSNEIEEKIEEVTNVSNEPEIVERNIGSVKRDEESEVVNDKGSEEKYDSQSPVTVYPEIVKDKESEDSEVMHATEKVVDAQSPVEEGVQSPVAQEDNSQAEIELTVEENVIEEAAVLVNDNSINSDKTSKAIQKVTELPKPELLTTSLKPNEMEEVYDYEHDDTKEEGELSANESVSPIHEMFNKYPVEDRKRSWGRCSVFNFNRTSLVANEHVLKDYNITKRSISKEDLGASDSEDLIFVKEIREENIVHEIESETNNTSYFDKDDDDIMPLSPSSKAVNKDIVRKKTSEADKIRPSKDRLVLDDKSEYKRFLKDSKIRSGDGKLRSDDGKLRSADGKTVLYITCLVRPFTVNQLRELLLRTGRIVEDGFWIDSIKSKCYVQFETEDEALETRHALHGIRWPVNNPKVLNVQFATQDDLLRAQAQTHESEIPRKTEPLIIENHNNEHRRIDWKKHFEQYDDRPRKVKDIREWDIGKPAHPDEMVYTETEESKRKKEEEENRKSRKEKRRKNEISDDEYSAKKQRKHNVEAGPSQSEAKLLDDLFRRTKASPSIYWLPLSDEQISVKQETRRKHLEDIDRQMKKREENTSRDSHRRGRERRRSRR